MSDAECPYCGEDVEIYHDDGYGYEEYMLHQQECSNCEKTFVFNTTISYSYSAKSADCLNDGTHDWKPTNTFPAFFTEMRCTICDEARKLTAEERTTYGIPDKFVL